jgi:hypothetical protein
MRAIGRADITQMGYPITDNRYMIGKARPRPLKPPGVCEAGYGVARITIARQAGVTKIG